MFVILVGILFNVVPTLSVFFQIYSCGAHKREATDVNMGSGKIKKKSIKTIIRYLGFFFFFAAVAFFSLTLETTSLSLIVFD